MTRVNEKPHRLDAAIIGHIWDLPIQCHLGIGKMFCTIILETIKLIFRPGPMAKVTCVDHGGLF